MQTTAYSAVDCANTTINWVHCSRPICLIWMCLWNDTTLKWIFFSPFFFLLTFKAKVRRNLPYRPSRRCPQQGIFSHNIGDGVSPTSVTRWLNYFFNIWPLTTMKIWLIAKNPKVGSKFCQMQNKPSIDCQRVGKFLSKSGHTVPNTFFIS